MIKKNCKGIKGITLIALVITIIIMLILVAVTITIAVNGGLFGYAGKATRDTEFAKQEELKLADGSLEVNGKKYDSPQGYIDGEESKTWYVEDLLDENGVLTENAFYKDANNEIVEIPKGFKVSDKQDENTKAGGLVIIDEIGNEFVWVPVEFNSTNTDTNENGLDDGFETVFYRSAWNNNARTTGLDSRYVENASNDPTGRYEEMRMSVQNHKGFYVGRYEAGEKENGKTVSKRDKRPDKTYWASSMTNHTDGAVGLCLNMYNDEKYGVVSTMCYGVEWDAMLDFVKDEEHNVTASANWGNYLDTEAEIWKITRTEAQYYKKDSDTEIFTWYDVIDYLNKNVVKLTTGANDNFKAKNIYDVAGNSYEWTMEASGNNARVIRRRKLWR